MRLKVKHLVAEKKLKVKKKQGTVCFPSWLVVVGFFMVVGISLWLAVAI